MKILGYYKGRPFTSDDIGDFFGSSTLHHKFTKRDRNISEESISYKNENQKEEREESQVRVIGKSIMEVLPNLNKM